VDVEEKQPMTLRKSSTVLRVLVGLALSFGFLGFATHSHALQRGPSAHVQLAQQSTTAEL
jgi:hypothetical protein